MRLFIEYPVSNTNKNHLSWLGPVSTDGIWWSPSMGLMVTMTDRNFGVEPHFNLGVEPWKSHYSRGACVLPSQGSFSIFAPETNSKKHLKTMTSQSGIKIILKSLLFSSETLEQLHSLKLRYQSPWKIEPLGNKPFLLGSNGLFSVANCFSF